MTSFGNKLCAVLRVGEAVRPNPYRGNILTLIFQFDHGQAWQAVCV